MIKHIKNCDIYTAETPRRFRSNLFTYSLRIIWKSNVFLEKQVKTDMFISSPLGPGHQIQMRKFWHIKSNRSYIKETFYFYFLLSSWESTLAKILPVKIGGLESLTLAAPTNNGHAPSTPVGSYVQLV